MASFSAKIIDHLAENGTINPDDKELYSYGLHQGLLMIANVLTTVVIGLVFGMFWSCIIFMVAYMPLRSFAGGFHARTQLMCYIYSIILTVAVLALVRFIPWTSLLCVIASIISGTLIAVLAPVEDQNKPLDSVEVRVYKKRALYILIVDLLAMLICLAFGFLNFSASISVSLLALSVMLILGKVSNSRYSAEYSESNLT